MLDTIAALANRQLKLTLLGGVALTPLFGLAAALAMYHPWAHYWSGDVPPVLKFSSQALGLCSVLLVAGAPAALIAGWLRLAPMRWLFEQALSRSKRLAWAMVGTLLLFEATVLLAAGLGFWVTKVPFTTLWSICTGFSLPWLVAALGATWRVLRQHNWPALVVE